MSATTFRSDVCDGILAVLNTFIAANPTLLLAAYRARPSGFPDLPAAYIAERSEDILHDSQTRTRTLTTSVLVVDQISDNAETMQRFDTLVDALIDAFSAAPQFSTTGVWSRMSVADEQVDFGDYVLTGARFTFPDLTIMEGRP
jgi:hypothetical protein